MTAVSNWMDTLEKSQHDARLDERKRILTLLKSIECVGCDMGVDCSFLDSRDYLILVIEESQA